MLDARATRLKKRPGVAASMVRGIWPDTLYTLADLQALANLGREGLRVARANGLVVRYVGGRGYVLGADFIGYVAEKGRDSKN